MKTNNLTGMILAVAVGIICIGAVLLPVLSDATATEETLTNDGYFRMSHYDATSNHTLTWTYENPNVLTVDDVALPLGYDEESGSVSIVIDTNFIVRCYLDSDGDVSSIAYVAAAGGTIAATVAASQTAAFTFTSGTLSATIGSNSVSNTYTDIYLPDSNGSFIMKKSDEVAYVNADSEIVAYGLSKISTSTGIVSGPGIGFSFIGNYEDGVTGTVWRGVDNTTVSDETVNATAVDKYVDIYALESVTAIATFTETVDGETVTTDTELTYNYFLVPYQVTSELSAHLDSTQIAIIMVIPVLMIIAVLLVAVRGLTRYD